MRWLFAIAVSLALIGPAAAQSPGSFSTLTTTGTTTFCSGKPWIDLLCFGADPTGVANSSAAFTSLFAAAVAARAPMRIPTGTYKADTALVLELSGLGVGGLRIISDGAVINGVTVTGGPVFTVQRSGGTPGAPAVIADFHIEGSLIVKASVAAYACQIGTSDLSDIFTAPRIERLTCENASTSGLAGGARINNIGGGDLSISGTTAGASASVGAVAINKMVGARLSGGGSAAGASAPSLLFDGASTNNHVAAFDYGASATGLSITAAGAANNLFVAPNFSGNANPVHAPQPNVGNMIIAPTGLAGPLSGGISVVGRGGLSRYSAPAVASYVAKGADDGLILSAANATGAGVGFDAASLPVTLPTAASVGAGWTMGFTTAAGKAVVLTPPGGVSILAGDMALAALTMGGRAYEFGMLVSDGANFRLAYASQRTLAAAGAANYAPSHYEFPGGPGYQATQGDNGGVISSGASSAGLTVTLPSTTAIQSGWSIRLVRDAGQNLTVQVNGVSGSTIVMPGSTATTLTLPPIDYSALDLQFDGAVFRIVNPGPDPDSPISVRSNPYNAKCDGVTDDTAALNAAFNSGKTVYIPALATCLVAGAGGVQVGNHTTIYGMDGRGGNPLGGAQIMCALGVTPCVTVGDFNSDSSTLRNFNITRAAGTIPAGSKGLYIKGTYNNILDNVGASRHDDCIYFFGSNFTGLHATVYNPNTLTCQRSHIVADGWPELYVVGGRLGTSGTGDIHHSHSYVRITGGSEVFGGIGPNGITFAGTQFNQGNATTADHWIYFENVLGGGSQAVIFRFSGSHIEGNFISTIGSNSGTAMIDQLQVVNNTFNTDSPFFGLDPATQLGQSMITGNKIACTTFTLNQTAVLIGVEISGNKIGCPVNITGAPGSTAQMMGNSYGGNFTLAGAWSDLSVIGGTFAAGGLINTSTGNVTVIIPGGGYETRLTGNLVTSKTLRTTGSANPDTAGLGGELRWTGTATSLLSINRTGNVLQPLTLDGSLVTVSALEGVLVSDGIQVGKTIRSIGADNPTTGGLGGELRWTGTATSLLSINRTGNIFQPVSLDGSAIALNSNGGNITGEAAKTTLTGHLEAGLTVRTMGAGDPPAAGSGGEFRWTGTETSILSYNRTGSAFLPLVLDASAITLNTNAGPLTVNGNAGWTGTCAGNPTVVNGIITAC